jgi:Zn-dependent membrane protease YugP
LRSYRNRYLLETGAANPSARTLNTSEEEMGEMMRFVIAHEVGHALGFPHNMELLPMIRRVIETLRLPKKME